MLDGTIYQSWTSRLRPQGHSCVNEKGGRCGTRIDSKWWIEDNVPQLLDAGCRVQGLDSSEACVSSHIIAKFILPERFSKPSPITGDGHTRIFDSAQWLTTEPSFNHIMNCMLPPRQYLPWPLDPPTASISSLGDVRVPIRRQLDLDSPVITSPCFRQTFTSILGSCTTGL